MPTLSDFTANTITGEEQPLKTYAGKVALVVNTASKCGFTPQFEGLEKLHSQYADRDSWSSASPATSSATRTPAGNDEIGAFCQKNYGVTFPMFEKVDVNGSEAHPLFDWLPMRRAAARRRDQVELHQVPDRSRRQGAQALRVDDQAGEDRLGHRGRARCLRAQATAPSGPSYCAVA